MAERSGSVDMEASVISLPSLPYRDSNHELFSTSLGFSRKNLRRPPLPPVRNDSMKKTMSKMIRSPRAFQSFEEKFSFNMMEDFPAPLPLTIVKKSYPSKELFGCTPSPCKKEEEEDFMPLESVKKTVKKQQRLSLDPAALFSRFRTKIPGQSPAIKPTHITVTECIKDHQSKSTRDSLKENLNGGQCKSPNKPPIAQKPRVAVLERTNSTAHSPRRQERGVCRSLSVASPSPSRLRRRCEEGLGNKIRREIVTRPAPPLPPPLR